MRPSPQRAISDVGSGTGTMLCALTSQIIRDVKQDAEDLNIDEEDAWKYQEEIESDSAESGGADTLQDQIAPDDALRAHKKLRNGYRRLIRKMTQRCESLRDGENSIGVEEFWRLGAVNLLLLNGCERTLNNTKYKDSVLVPEDILSDYLPAIAIMFGRVRLLASVTGSSGPLALKAKLAPDQHVRRLGVTTAVILSALLEARHRWLQQPEYVRGKDVPHGQADVVEIVAARSLSTLIRLGLQPTSETFAEFAKETMQQSCWLSGIGIPVLQKWFHELSRRAKLIIKAEDEYDSKHTSTPSNAVKEGAWVCAPSTGVTEVMKVIGKNVELAMIGENTKEKKRLLVTVQMVVPTGMVRSLQCKSQIGGLFSAH